MKKFLFILMLATQFLHAQEQDKSPLMKKKNEVRFDVLSLLTASKLNLTYERFLSKNYSVGVSGFYSDNKKVNDDFDNGFRNSFPKYEVVPFVRYNFTTNADHYYFAEIFANANGGDFRETVRNEENGIGYYIIQKTSYTDIALGGAAGYKLYFKDKFGVEFLVGFGRNLTNRRKSPDVMSRVGLSFAYRF